MKPTLVFMSCIKSCTQIILIDGLHVYIPRMIFIYNKYTSLSTQAYTEQNVMIN